MRQAGTATANAGEKTSLTDSCGSSQFLIEDWSCPIVFGPVQIERQGGWSPRRSSVWPLNCEDTLNEEHQARKYSFPVPACAAARRQPVCGLAHQWCTSRIEKLLGTSNFRWGGPRTVVNCRGMPAQGCGTTCVCEPVAGPTRRTRRER